MTIGQRVTYANGLYVVAAVDGDLLTLDGVADAQRSCRERVTVLASDVTVLPSQRVPGTESGPKTAGVVSEATTTETGGCL